LEAHKTIDRLLDFIGKADEKQLRTKIENLSNFSDTKGEIYQIEQNFEKAIEWYQKSLKYGDFSHKAETIEKMNLCKGLKKN
jgi:uncharacterized membrane protein YgaE (UPF0421/DUF939 family)